MAKIFYAPTGELYQYKYYFEEDFSQNNNNTNQKDKWEKAILQQSCHK